MASFPSSADVAFAFYTEAIRHFEDAHFLKESRYAASIASSQKAAELAIKSLFLFDGVLGWWDKLFDTHSPLKSISASTGHVLSRHIGRILAVDQDLVDEIKLLESLAPEKPGKDNFN